MNPRFDRHAAALILALLLIAAGAALRPFSAACGDVREHTLRLHVIAGSDSDADQRRKLLVRDAVLHAYGPVLASAGSAKGAEEIAARLAPAIAETARETLLADGEAEPVSAAVTEMFFATSRYENGVFLPAGRYRALRLVIGAGKGHNWWCVLYPPLCLPAAAPGAFETPDGERVRTLDDSDHLVPKLAAVELFERTREAILQIRDTFA